MKSHSTTNEPPAWLVGLVAIAGAAVVGGAIALAQPGINNSQVGSQSVSAMQPDLPMPTIKQGCYYRSATGQESTDFAGLYVPIANTIYLCQANIPSPELMRFTVAHELAHWRQQQQGKLAHAGQERSPSLTLAVEAEADYWAIHALLQRGDCAAIGAYAQWRNVEPPYQSGVAYAQSVYRQFCSVRQR